MTQNAKRNLRLGVASLALLLSLFGAWDKLFGVMGLDRLSEYNHEYLESSYERALGGFLTLSAIKAGLAVLEGSEIGISLGANAQIEIGDVVQSIYDYVDTAWSTLLTGTAVLLGMRYLLDAVALFDGWLLSVTLALVLACLVLSLVGSRLSLAARLTCDAARFMTVLTIAGYLIAPLSITGASFLSRHITTPLTQEAEQDLERLGKDLSLDKAAEEKGLMSRFNATREELQRVYGNLSEKTREMATLVIKIITGYVFDCIVFPLLVFNVLLLFIKSVTGYAFGSRVMTPKATREQDSLVQG